MRRAALVVALGVAVGCAATPNDRGPSGRGLVALTFDDGPADPHTGRILDILRAHDARATFFLVGMNVERRPDLARRILAEGHEVANHTYAHLYTLSFMPGTTMQRDADRGEAAIAAATGLRPRLLRYPLGLVAPNGARARAASDAADRVQVSYSVRARDVESDDPPARIAARVVEAAFDGAILVLHDGHKTYACAHQEATVAALPAILAGLRARGLRPVVVSELLGVAPYRVGWPPAAGPPVRPPEPSPKPKPQPLPEPPLPPPPTIHRPRPPIPDSAERADR